MTQEAQQVIDECRNHQSFKLDLTNSEIAYLPDFTDIGRHLTVLFIVDNKISDISPLSALVNLTELYMSNNQIRKQRCKKLPIMLKNRTLLVKRGDIMLIR